MIQPASVILHLLRILMHLALLVDNPGRKIEKCLPVPQILRLHQRHSLRQFSFNHLQKCVVIRPGERHVRIIIPRDEALMAHRTQESSRIQNILYPVFPANPVNFLQNSQVCLMDFFKIVILHLVSFSPCSVLHCANTSECSTETS